jgi:hypothetical protein
MFQIAPVITSATYPLCLLHLDLCASGEGKGNVVSIANPSHHACSSNPPATTYSDKLRHFPTLPPPSITLGLGGSERICLFHPSSSLSGFSGHGLVLQLLVHARAHC